VTQEPETRSNAVIEEDGALIAPLPRISVQAFCETTDVVNILQKASQDRRMLKTHVKINMGGAAAAVEAYRTAPTPNLIIIEMMGTREALIEQLDILAGFCDVGTKVVVIGKINDIMFYRQLVARGVSEYLVSPFTILEFISSLSLLYATGTADVVGKVIAVSAAKGGVGSSTVAHNLGWSISNKLDMSTVIVDLDLPFGTAGLDFNQDPPQGISEVIFSPDRVDANFMDRLMSRCSDKLSLIAAPATLERSYDFSETTFDQMLDILRSTVPYIILDLPHVWTHWSRRLMVNSDELVIVAEPDLASLRNTKNMLEALREARPNDHPPHLVMNRVGLQKRPEIGVDDFVKAVGTKPSAEIPFDAKLFGTASNNGHMLAEVEAAHKSVAVIDNLGRLLTGRAEAKKERKFFMSLFSKL
jgi:pilus assembly protein CpaE